LAPDYGYLFATFERPAARGAAERGASVARAVKAVGGELVGQFTPQLGWAANEAALLLRGPSEALEATTSAAVQALTSLSHTSRQLTPTVRPDSPAAQLQPGGIYVHRWFVVAAGDEAEFVRLSAEAWPGFEGQFDARIFGLFRAAPNDAETTAGEVSLLLITRYGDHGVWETSRDPTTEAMQIFARRLALTRRTQAASTQLVGP
jgi:hypothetical protein